MKQKALLVDRLVLPLSRPPRQLRWPLPLPLRWPPPSHWNPRERPPPRRRPPRPRSGRCHGTPKGEKRSVSCVIEAGTSNVWNSRADLAAGREGHLPLLMLMEEPPPLRDLHVLDEVHRLFL